MALGPQKYGTLIRTVSGTVSVEPEDEVLKVTTSSQAATINLQTFTSGYWSTQYKLYIIDDSNNAATYNITINAPAGYTINGASSAIINSNGGSAIVRIVSNAAYQAQLSSFSSTSLPLPFFYSTKLLQTPATTYLAVAGGGQNSVFSGTQFGTYDTSINNNLSGFNSTTGIFVVPATGYYTFGASLVTRINANSVDTVNNGAGPPVYWVTNPPPDGIGFLSLGIIKAAQGAVGGENPKIICAEKQFVNQSISDVNIECTSDLYYCTAADQISVYGLNKTNYAIIGIAQRTGQPDCLINFSAKKIS